MQMTLHPLVDRFEAPAHPLAGCLAFYRIPSFIVQQTGLYSPSLLISCSVTADRPNAIWQADHTLLDIMLVRDEARPAKPWLTVVSDDYSRAVAGYFLSFEAPSSIQTASALRQAIWRKEDARWHVCAVASIAAAPQ